MSACSLLGGLDLCCVNHWPAGMDGVLWVFSGLSLCGAVFGKCLLPETNGRTLREIEMAFAGSGGEEAPGPTRDKKSLGQDDGASGVAAATVASALPCSGARRSSRGDAVVVAVDTNDDAILDIVQGRDAPGLARQR